jgi:hypothetical protein
VWGPVQSNAKTTTQALQRVVEEDMEALRSEIDAYVLTPLAALLNACHEMAARMDRRRELLLQWEHYQQKVRQAS